MSEIAKRNTDMDFSRIFALPLRLGKGTENEAPIFDRNAELVGQCVDDDCYERALAFIRAVNSKAADPSDSSELTREQILERLEILRNKLVREGSYVRSNTIWLAIEEIRKAGPTQKPWITEEQAAKLVADAKASEAKLPWAKEADWRYEIKYGPEGEANYAWVYLNDEMICVAQTHHAKAIVDAALASPSHTMGVKGDADEEMHEIGYRDGYEKAVQDIDQLTGGDGEYRYCTDHDPDRHTPDADTMKQRIVERFETLNTMESVSEINEWQSRATAAEASAERNGKWLDDLARAVVEHFRIEEPSDGFYDIHTTAHEILNGDFTTDSDADRRAESAEKRIAELEARYQQAKEALDKVRDLAEDGQSHGLSADLICAEIVAVIDALKGKQP